MSHTVQFAWHDSKGRRHTDSFQSDTADRSVNTEIIKSRYPAKRVTILGVMRDNQELERRREAHREYIKENNAAREKQIQDMRDRGGQMTSGTISGTTKTFERNPLTDAAGTALVGLTGAALGFAARGLWKGGKLGVKGIGVCASAAREGINQAADEAEAAEQAAKDAGPKAYAAYQKQQNENFRIASFIGLGSLSAFVPGLGVVIYSMGFGPYWGNKAGDAICKKNNITNKWAKMALIGTLMIPVGIPVGMLSFAAVDRVVDVVRLK